MNRSMVLGIAALAILFAPPSASAQEDRNLGLVFSPASTIGLEWRVSEKIALRPDVSFSFSDSESDDDDAESSGTSVSFGLSALVTARKWNDLTTYVAPRFTIGRSSNETRSNSLDIETTTVSYAVGGSFGAHYAFADRFAVFGEAGVAYSHATIDLDAEVLPSANRSSSGFGTRSAVGVVLYF